MMIGYKQKQELKMAKKKLPTPRDTKPGDVLVHLSTSGRGQFTVTRLDGDWAWGEGEGGRGFYAVPLSECVTLDVSRTHEKEIDLRYGRSLGSIEEAHAD